MVNLLREFPLSDLGDSMSEEKIKKVAYTKQEVDVMIAFAVQKAVAEAKGIIDYDEWKEQGA